MIPAMIPALIPSPAENGCASSSAERFRAGRRKDERLLWGGWIRTNEWRIQSPLPYHLATPHRGRMLCTFYHREALRNPIDPRVDAIVHFRNSPLRLIEPFFHAIEMPVDCLELLARASEPEIHRLSHVGKPLPQPCPADSRGLRLSCRGSSPLCPGYRRRPSNRVIRHRPRRSSAGLPCVGRYHTNATEMVPRCCETVNFASYDEVSG